MIASLGYFGGAIMVFNHSLLRSSSLRMGGDGIQGGLPIHLGKSRWNLKITQLKSGKSSEPNLHWFRMLLFQCISGYV